MAIICERLFKSSETYLRSNSDAEQETGDNVWRLPFSPFTSGLGKTVLFTSQNHYALYTLGLTTSSIHCH
jgi:hypothetical protein